MRQVVFLTYAYPPLRYPRSIQIYRLVKYSRHRIRVVSAAPEPAGDDTIDENLPGRPVGRLVVPRPPDPLRRVTARWRVPDTERGWARRAARRVLAERLVGPRDVLVSFGNPMSTHLAGLRIKKALGVPWIAHFSDPWTDNPYRRLPPLAAPIDRRMESAVVEAADGLIFTSRETVDLVMAKYPPALRAKATVLPHAYDPALFASSAARPPGRPLLGRHVGSFYDHRTPGPFAAALARLERDEPDAVRDVEIEFVGEVGAGLERPDAASRIRFSAHVDYRTSLRLMRESDFLLVVDAPFETSVFLPSKLIEYIGAGRPILAISPPGAAASLVERLGGFVADPRDPERVIAQLRATLARARARDDAPFGDPAVRAAYAAPDVVARFDQLIDAA